MAVLVIASAQMDKELYQKLLGDIAWEAQRPEGAIFHCAAFDQAGVVHVVDVWESEEAAVRHFERHVRPVFLEKKLAAPKLSMMPVHDMAAHEGIELFRI